VAELKERVMEAAGRVQFCDPDYYPIARADEREIAVRRFGEVQADPAFAVILVHLRIPPSASYSDDQKLAVYREWKALAALALTPVAGGGSVPDAYSFDYRAAKTSGPSPAPREDGVRVVGSVDGFGVVDVRQRTDAGPLMCPICLALGTRIATPTGGRAVEDLRVGDVVWTPGDHGERVAAALVAVGSTPVPATHRVVRLALDDGRIVLASPGHPTADGRRVGDLRAGAVLDGARVVSAERVAYAGGATFDVLPGGTTGAYWADGVLLGSTLRSP